MKKVKASGKFNLTRSGAIHLVKCWRCGCGESMLYDPIFWERILAQI